MAKSRVDDITSQIQAKKVELENAHVDIAQAIIGTVGLVASLIAAIPTAGTSLVGAVTSIATIVDSVQKSGVLDLISELAKPSEQQNAIKELKKQAVGIQGYVKGAVSSIDTIISFPKMLEELWTAKIDNEGYRKLIADSITLVHQQLLAKLRKTQAGFTSQAAQKRFDQGVVNKASAKTQLDGLQQEVPVLEKASLSLIRMAQHYMNILTQYAFFSARALEIYTLSDKSQDIRYDYGYIHPDFEANYKLGLIPMASLLEQYNFSWGRLADMLKYKKQYDQYFSTGNWIHDYHRMAFKDRILLSEFRSKPKLDFTIRIEDLPSSRFEAKVESVYVAFVGGKSKPQNITAIIEHSGRYEEKKRDGSKVETSLKSRAGVVSAKLTPLQSDGGIGISHEMDFWGRGLAADYHLYIEADEIKNSGVDLSGVIEIQVWIGYQAFLMQTPAAGSPMIDDGILLQDEEDGRMYVTYGSAKMPISHTSSLTSLGLRKSAIDKQKSKELVSLLSTIPADNTLLREERSDKMYVIKKGLKLEIPATAELHRLGLDISDLKQVPEAALNMLPYGGSAE